VVEFWYSFMHYPQARFGGITEYAHICFEKHGMAFPDDWPGTRAGREEEVRRAGKHKAQWERRPNGKRESWGRVVKGGEIGDPFSCDWRLLFKKDAGKVSEGTANMEGNDANDKPVVEGVEIETIRAQAKAAMEVQVNDPPSTDDFAYFLLSPAYGKKLLTPTSPMQTPIDLSHALLPIRLHFLRKGNVAHRARIYHLPTSPEHRQKWTQLVKSHKVPKSEYPACPDEEDLLGFVTTGNVSLLEGRGRAVGALCWERVQVDEARWEEDKEFRRWCIVRDVGKDVGRLARWEVND
jgi:ribonuclease P/MRP protein subunit POP1